MADNHQARADAEETKQADDAGEQSHAPDAVHSNEKGNDDFDQRIAEANSPEELAMLTQELLARGETPATDEEGEEPADNREAATGEDAGEQSGEDKEARAAEENVEEQEESGKKTEKDDERGEEDRELERVRLRVSKRDVLGRRAIEIQRRNPDLTLDECLQRARAESGEKPETTKGDAEIKGDAKADDGPRTVEEADKRLAELRAERRKAMTDDLDFAKAADLDEQMDALRDKRAELIANKATEADSAARKYDAAFDAAQARALELYDFVRDADSPEAKRMLEIDATLKEDGDPLYNDPEKPLILARMVAREYAIAPKSKTSTKTSAASAPKAPAKPKTVAPIASGNSRTASTASTNKAGQQLLEAADRIQSPAEMEEFLASLRS